MDTKSTNALQATQMPTVTVAGEIQRNDRFERTRHETLLAMCHATNKQPDQILELVNCEAASRISRLEEYCKRLEKMCQALEHKGGSCNGKCSTIDQRCNGLWKFCIDTMCPGRVPFSRYTMDEASQESQIVLGEIVKVDDPNAVDEWPVAPSQFITLTHPERPGFIPKVINIDLHLANGGNNYLDIEIEFYLVSGGKKKMIGVTFEGNNFLNKDGTQIFVGWPEYKGRRIEVGYAERIEVVLRHKGLQNNLVSASVRLPHDLKEWYELCKQWGYGDCLP